MAIMKKLVLRSDLPDIRPGDTVKVIQRIKEGSESRLSAFEGIVIAKKHGREPGATFTVRKVVDGVGAERIFPLHSPTIEKIEILRRSKVRRAKLYYIRKKAAREVRKKIKQVWQETTKIEQPTTEMKAEETEKPAA
jgi:large subunit ribosomal protein L19